MLQFEYDYGNLVSKIVRQGQTKLGRNGYTQSVFGEQLKITELRRGNFPALSRRQVYPKAVFGELAAILRKPTCVGDFEKWGCNYWSDWADVDGNLELDYGNAWFEHDQIATLKHLLRTDPSSRRMIIDAWRPERLGDLSLPCCHYAYQFYTDQNGKRLHLAWIQRSVDVMIGLPADIMLASALLLAVANEFGMTPGDITMQLGDCHIYNAHWQGAKDYLTVRDIPTHPRYELNMPEGAPFEEFEPSWINVTQYNPITKIPMEVII